MRMKLMKSLVSIAVFSSVAFAAATYNLTLPNPIRVGSTELKPGNYKIAVEGDKAVITKGKEVVAEAPATVETVAQKYSVTEMSTDSSELRSVSVGGTKMKIVFKKQ